MRGNAETVLEMFETVMLSLKANDETFHKQALESWRDLQVALHARTHARTHVARTHARRTHARTHAPAARNGQRLRATQGG